MSWNHRVFHTRHTYGTICSESFTIREVFYDATMQAIEMISEEESSPFGETVEELESDLRRMILALCKPILTPQDVPGYEYGLLEVPIEKE